MLVTNKEILSIAKAEGYAVGAFNINNLETLLAIVEASVEELSPVIVAATPSAIRYAGLEYLVGMVKAAAESASVPMALHLDHGKDVETVSRCIDAGFTSVMIDGSHLNFEENISLVKGVVIIILGGLGSLPGAVLGGLLLGVLESFTFTFLGTWAEIVTFGILIFVILFRPQGLLGYE